MLIEKVDIGLSVYFSDRMGGLMEDFNGKLTVLFRPAGLEKAFNT